MVCKVDPIQISGNLYRDQNCAKLYTGFKRGILQNCAKLYRDQKHKFKKSCIGDGNELPEAPPENMSAENWEKLVKHINDPTYVRRSVANKAVREKQTIVVRTGRKSLAQVRYENRNKDTNEPPSLIEEYARLRSHIIRQVKEYEVVDSNIMPYCSLDKQQKKTIGEMEREFLQALQVNHPSWLFHSKYEEFDNLKEELMWEGSSVVMLSTDCHMRYKDIQQNKARNRYEQMEIKIPV